jgi:lysophospholipase L1-like esterase
VSHVVLLGDSIFDNAAYVGGAPDVVRQLREALPSGSRATLAALDGGVVADVPRQLARVPDDATHLVISVGGNDALGQSGILEARAGSVAEVLHRLAAIQDQFRSGYAAMLDKVLERRLPLAVCTVYDPRYPDPIRRRLSTLALGVVNDAILREAFLRNLPLFDLRLICADDTDFANPIEPSARGGQKIANAIAAWVTGAHANVRAEVIVR